MKQIGEYFIYRDSFNETIAYIPTVTFEKHKLGANEPTEESVNFRFLKLRFVIGWFPKRKKIR